MKRVWIESLRLRWFKGVENADYEFGDGVNVVKGRNGAGKSTIADAAFWVLFGVNSAGETKFGVKTKDSDGREIADVEHSVEIKLNKLESEDGLAEAVTLERILTETRRKDGSVTNNYTYKVNGEVETAGDFAKVVENLCPETVFRLCGSPQAFVRQDWTEQRKRLTEMFGEPNMEDITGGEKRFDAVEELLKKEDLEKVMKHLKYKRKEVQTALDSVPVRLEELEKVLPEKDDWDGIAKELHDAELERDDLQRQQHYAEAGQGASVEAENIRHKLEFAMRRRREMETGAQMEVRRIANEQIRETKEAARRTEEAEENVKALTRKRDSMEELAMRCDERYKELDAEKQDGAALWQTVSARKWEWNDADSFCPTCGQALPQDRLEEMKRESEQRFNASVAEEKKTLMEKAARIKDESAECEKNAEHYRDEKKAVQKQLEEAERQFGTASAEYKVMMDKETPTVAEILKGNRSYEEVKAQIENLEAQLDSVQKGSIDNELVKKLQKSIAEKDAEIEGLVERLTKKLQWDKVTTQMEAAKADRTKWQEQLDELDETLAAACEFQQRACAALEERVNGHFGTVEWCMFRRQLDGTEKPWCECSVDGVPYGDLNSAGKTNAGLDIVETLKKYYGISVPCIIDNAETVLEPLYKSGQQIRLTVTEDEEIKVECAF